MKSTLSTLLIPFAALALMASEAEARGRFASGATTIQGHTRPTPTPTPHSPGDVNPGDTGGAHRSSSGVVNPGGTGGAHRSSSGTVGVTGRADRTENSRDTGAAATTTSGEAGGVESDFEGPIKARGLRQRSRPAHRGKVLGLFATRVAGSPPACDPAKQLQNELSGTYSGYIEFEGQDLRGDAELTVCGNEFSLVVAEKEVSGMVSSVTTSDYTAAAFRFTAGMGFEARPLSWPKTVSVTVSRSGGGTSFRSAPGEPSKFLFTGSIQRP